MFRFFFRFLALLCLVGAVIGAVIDASRSIAASSLSLTSFGELWSGYAPDSLGVIQAMGSHYLGADIWSAISNFVLAMPALAILMVLAVSLYIASYKRTNRYGRFASN